MKTAVLYLTLDEMGIVDEQGVRALPALRLTQHEEKMRELEMRHAWKTTGEGAQFMGKQNPYPDAAAAKGKVTAIAPLGHEMIYAAAFPSAGGIYRKDFAAPDSEEPYVFVDQAMRMHDLHVRDHRIAVSVDTVRGERHIGLLHTDKPGMQLLTDGDTVDSAPFITADGTSIEYASSGYARDEAGKIIAQGPSALLRLSLFAGTLDVLHESPAHDYLRPKRAPDGTLYCIRRPYRQGDNQGGSLKDALLSPFRFMLGIGRFFSLIGRAFSNQPAKPNQASTNVKAKQQSGEDMMINGIRVQVDKAMREAEQRGDKHPGYAPGDWELVRETPAGGFETLRKGVIDFDFLPDGGIVLTNGRYILKLENGEETVLAKDRTVLRVAAAYPRASAEGSPR